MADPRMVGQGLRRRMGAHSSTLAQIEHGTPYSPSWRGADAELLAQESDDPTFGGKRDNLRRMEG